MSVILEFTIDSEDFQLGRALSSAPDDMHLELERLVPTGDMTMPFIWATGENHQAFEEQVQDESMVKEFLALDRVGDSGLYRIEWTDKPMDLIAGIAATDAVVLEARGNDTWLFRLRFLDHATLSQFHNFIIEHRIPIHIERTYTLIERLDSGYRFDLSPEQREALVLALRRGYFETPSEASLDDLAEELGISRQALSNRIRLGNQKILEKVLLSSVAGHE